MRSPVQDYLERLLDDIRPLDSGMPYQTILPTADMDPGLFAVGLTTVDGHSYCAGDDEQKFSIQSISKAFTYAMALEDLGPDKVQEKIDVEPSGDPFNEISLQAATGRPDNPMINAGAIATTSLIKGRGGRDRIGRILHTFSDAAGRELKVSEAVFKAEDRAGHRNRALAWLLRSFNIIESDPEPAVQDYFRQCSVMVTVKDLSVMAATLANQGRNPVTGEQVFAPRTVRWVLSVLSTCGMYDDAGTWAIEVGLPSKSGVSGALLVVVPGQIGIGVFSPNLNDHGTSVRGAATIKRLADDLGLHYGDAPPVGRSTIRATYDLAEAPSGVPRGAEAMQVIEGHGDECHIVELGGDIGFAEAETLARSTTALPESVRTLMVDMSKVDDFGRAAVRMLNHMVRIFLSEGRDILLVDDDRALAEAMIEFAQDSPFGPLPDPFADATDAGKPAEDSWDPSADEPAFRLFLSRSLAVEWMEQRVLSRNAPALVPSGTLEPDRSPLLELFSKTDAQTLSAFMEIRDFRAGQVIRRAGQPFGGIYFITSGQVELTSQGAGGRQYKQVFLSPGMIFGEIALGQGGRQVTTVRAVSPVTTQVLTAQVISALEESDPQLAIKFWSAMTRDAYTTVEQMLREAGARND